MARWKRSRTTNGSVPPPVRAAVGRTTRPGRRADRSRANAVRVRRVRELHVDGPDGLAGQGIRRRRPGARAGRTGGGAPRGRRPPAARGPGPARTPRRCGTGAAGRPSARGRGTPRPPRPAAATRGAGGRPGWTAARRRALPHPARPGPRRTGGREAAGGPRAWTTIVSGRSRRPCQAARRSSCRRWTLPRLSCAVIAPRRARNMSHCVSHGSPWVPRNAAAASPVATAVHHSMNS